MKRAGFTMIELIFVIVILGILAAVALPKMGETAESAKITTAEGFIGTFNRSIGPTMWTKAIRTGSKDGNVSQFDFTEYSEIPDMVVGGTIDMTKCGTTDKIGDIKIGDTTNSIFCQNGTSVNAPKIGFDLNGTDINKTTWE